MHHGATVVHWDAIAGGNRSARIFMRLERNCSTLTWGKTTWSALKSGSGAPDFSLKTDPEDCIPNALLNRSSVNCSSVIGKLIKYNMSSKRINNNNIKMKVFQSVFVKRNFKPNNVQTSNVSHLL